MLPPDVKLRDKLAERAVQEFNTANANPSIDLTFVSQLYKLKTDGTFARGLGSQCGKVAIQLRLVTHGRQLGVIAILVFGILFAHRDG